MRATACCIAVLGVVLGLTSSALAASCNDNYQACLRHETSMGKNAVKRCAPSYRRCQTLCKSGQPAYFVGPSTGRHFRSTCG